MKHRHAMPITLLTLLLTLSIAPAANAASTQPPLPTGSVLVWTHCDPDTDLCVTLFESAPGAQTDGPSGAAPTVNEYTCGVSVSRFGIWIGTLEQKVYGAWGVHNGVAWRLDSGVLNTYDNGFYWWASKNGPNPTDPWGTITIDTYVASSAWLLPDAGMHWVNAHFDAFGGYGCQGG